jgi:hypothetical protein
MYCAHGIFRTLTARCPFCESQGRGALHRARPPQPAPANAATSAPPQR